MPRPPRDSASCAASVTGPIGRRAFVAGAGLCALLPARVRGTSPDRTVAFGRPEAAALAGELAPVTDRIVWDPNVSPYDVRIADRTASIVSDVLLYGQGAARARFLDDARNGPVVLRAISAALADGLPEAAAREIERRRRRTALRLARRVFDWTRRLRGSVLHGRTVARDHGRPYLLRWAGATIDRRGGEDLPPPVARALAGLPDGPSEATLASYLSYVETLVDAVAVAP